MKKICKGCSKKFEAAHKGVKVCSPECGVVYAKEEIAKQKRKEARQAKKEMRESDKKYWRQQFRSYLHKWIREVRDKDKPCVSCGKKIGAKEKCDAGHFYSDGGHSALRYHEWNIHKQCVRCNRHLSGNLIEYAKRLPDRIGQEAFDWLDEHKNDIKSWTLEELKAGAKKYKLLCKEHKQQSTIYDIEGVY